MTQLEREFLRGRLNDLELSLPTTLTHRVLTTMTQGSRSRRVHSTLVVYVFKPCAFAAAGAGSEDAASARVARQGAGVSGSSRPR